MTINVKMCYLFRHKNHQQNHIGVLFAIFAVLAYFIINCIFFGDSLQKFKVQTANTVISGENSRLESMGTEQLLDLFSHNKSGSTSAANGGGGSGGVRTAGGGMKAILETLPDLWDQKQYEDEYDLSQFMTKLK